MLMEMHNIIQFVELFIGYFALVLVFPGIVFYKKTRCFSFSKRFLTHFILGNAYIVALVYFLEFLHIANRWTLWGFSIGFCLLLCGYFHKEKFFAYKEVLSYETGQLFAKQLGIRTYARRRRSEIGNIVKPEIKNIFLFFKRANAELLFFALILWFLWQICGDGILENCGYSSAKMFAHNTTINHLIENDIFSTKILHIGMDCILYYLSQMLNLSAFSVCRLFWLVQYSMFIFFLLAFLKCFCKSKYLPYFGIFLYLATNFFYEDTYERFSMVLPEEFSFLFLLPGLFLCYALLERVYKRFIKDREILRETSDEKRSIFWLRLILKLASVFLLTFFIVLFIKRYETISNLWTSYVMRGTYAKWMLLIIPFGILLGALLYYTDYDCKYGAVIMGMSVLFFGLCLLLGKTKQGTFTLLPTAIAYLTPILFVFCFDSFVYFICRKHMKEIGNFMSLLLIIFPLLFSMQFPIYKVPFGGGNMQMKESVLCIENILKQNKGKNFTWSIVSTSDEKSMVEEYGKHIESADFLNKLQSWNKGREFKISSKRVYFFVEKKPILTGKNILESSISPEMAMKSVPFESGRMRYTGKNRLIVMSKMFYWAKSFKQLHPKQFKVYYETSDFVCYYIEQNKDRLYNFAIDYGFNE